MTVPSQRKDRIDGFGAFVLVSFSAALGLNQALVKIVNTGMEPLFQAGLRSLLAGILVVGYARLTSKRLSISDGTLVPGVFVGVIFAVEFALLFSGIARTSVAHASVLFYTMPAWLAVAAHFALGERMTWRRFCGLVLAICGVGVALMWSGTGESHLSGDLLCLAGSFLWATIAVMMRVTRLQHATPHMQLSYQLMISAPILMVMSTVPGQFAFAMTPALWSVFAFQVVAVVAVGFLAWFWTLTVYPASDLAAYGFLAPLFGVAFGWLVLGETIGINIVVALLLVAAGLVLITAKRKKPSI